MFFHPPKKGFENKKYSCYLTAHNNTGTCMCSFEDQRISISSHKNNVNLSL
jgi:hypothetical protein